MRTDPQATEAGQLPALAGTRLWDQLVAHRQPGTGRPVRRRHRRPPVDPCRPGTGSPWPFRGNGRARLPDHVALDAAAGRDLLGRGATVVNYGANRLRFPAPLVVGSRVRLTADCVDVEAIAGGHQATFGLAFEREGGEKPVCVAELVFRFYEGADDVDLDPAGFGAAMMAAVADRARPRPPTPRSGSPPVPRWPASGSRRSVARSASVTPVLDREPRGQRFADPAWADNPAFYATEQAYLLLRRTGDRADRSGRRRRGDPAQGGLCRASGPRRARADQLPAHQPGGAQAGVRDRRAQPGRRLPRTSYATCLHNNGRPRQVDTGALQVGATSLRPPARSSTATT